MTTTAPDRTDALVERLFAATLGALELFSVYLGAELGRYDSLAQHGPLTPDELARRAGIAPRYRTGGGVPYEAYGRAFRHGQGHINRPAFTHELATDWLAAMPDVVDRLQAPGARVADVGCGQGWSSLAVARAFPHAASPTACASGTPMPVGSATPALTTSF